MFFYLIITAFGLIVGSFLSMLTYRLPRGLSLGGRSFCDNCRHFIRWYQNIPLVSFFLLRGKCKQCGKRISLRYPLIEFSTALVFLSTLVLWNTVSSNQELFLKSVFGSNAFFFYFLLITSYLLLIITDLEHHLLPDQILVLLAALVFIFLFLSPSPTLFERIFAGLLAFSFFLLIYLATRARGMGFGDVKMSFMIGAFLGFEHALVWLFLAFLSGSLVGLILIVGGKAHFGKPIPFGPFLLASAFITFFFGESIMRWYVSLG